MNRPPRSPENGALALVRALERRGVTTVFGYPGGAIMPVYDALTDSSLQHVLTRHEQGAALAAGGYARASGRPGVCLATSGPGATNLLTGIADACLDSVPLVAITGQVPSTLLGTDAFQEVDTIGMSLPVVKHSYAVERAEDLPAIVDEAFEVATAGRPGPVWIDVPKDVASAPLRACERDRESARAPVEPVPTADLAAAAALLASARRPVAYVGGGAVLADASHQLHRFLARTGMPAVTTLHGIGALPSDHAQLLGMLGMHGTRAANEAVQESDLLLCLGARFDDRVTGKLERFAPGAAVVHIDIDPAELGKLRRPTVAVRSDLRRALEAWPHARADRDAWLQRCCERRDAEARVRPRRAPDAGIDAPDLLRALTERAPGRWIVTSDVGQHQMWVAQHCRFAGPRQHLSSGGLGTMGFGIPAAIGAQFARPDRDVLAVTGDGSFLMNVQELATIRRYDLPIKIVVLDNQCLGMVRQWQELFHEQRYSEVDLSDNPDFTALASAFGIPSLRVRDARGLDAAVRRLENTDGPLLVHVAIAARQNVWPLVPPGAANDHMLEGV
jgi:acetolactate synthase-1/2/3 large subunit